MPFQIINEDILKVKVDAIVNPSNEYLLAFGSTDKLIHEKAGHLLDEECHKIGGIELGDAVITPSYEMENCTYIIHTAGPVYIDGKHNESAVLKKCYDNCLRLACENGANSIAFPLISSGTYQFPKGEAIEIASKAIINFLENNEMDIYLLIYDKSVFDTSKNTFRDIEKLLSHEPLNSNTYSIPSKGKEFSLLSVSLRQNKRKKEAKKNEPSDLMTPVYEGDVIYSEMASFVPDVSFGEYMISIIDERNLKDSDVYRKANISKSVFNDIKLNRHKPKKETLCALCFGLRLNLKESLDFLDKGGYSLSNFITFDRIIRHFLEIEYYDIYEINEVLYNHDCLLLGSKSH